MLRKTVKKSWRLLKSINNIKAGRPKSETEVRSPKLEVGGST